MDTRLLEYYNRELQYIRDSGAEFAEDHPDVGAALGLEQTPCPDPYVERLLEGFAFLSARVRLKYDDQFPEFTSQLLDLLYPNYLAPMPSCAVFQFLPDLGQDVSAGGVKVERGSEVVSELRKGETTRCRFVTTQEIVLWPIQIESVRYLASPEIPYATDDRRERYAEAALQIVLSVPEGRHFDQLGLDALTFYIKEGGPDVRVGLYEQLLRDACGLTLRDADVTSAGHQQVERWSVRARGFEEDEALLPATGRNFGGYRLVDEFFSFLEKFLFFDLCGLGRSLQGMACPRVELNVLFSSVNERLIDVVGVEQLALHASPAVNLFHRRFHRCHVKPMHHEHHVVVDRTKTLDYEVHSISAVTGYGVEGNASSETDFLPIYQQGADQSASSRGCYFTYRRRPRRLSEAEQRRRNVDRTGYVGSEVFISLVDQRKEQAGATPRELLVKGWCTNRELPVRLGATTRSDFTLTSGASLQGIHCLTSPTSPQPARPADESTWRLINHLSVNYLSLLEVDPDRAGEVIREILRLYVRGRTSRGDSWEQQIRALRTVSASNCVHRFPSDGPISFGRGTEITVVFEEVGFGGAGPFLFGAVLDHFFSRFASINSFTRTVVMVNPLDPRVLMRWPPRVGRRIVL